MEETTLKIAGCDAVSTEHSSKYFDIFAGHQLDKFLCNPF